MVKTLEIRQSAAKLVKLFVYVKFKMYICRMKTRQYTLDEDFFSVIDKEEKAYWLGFIFADGSVTIRSTGQAVLQIKCHIKDIDHLNKFHKDIGTNKPIKYYSQKTAYSNGKYAQSALISDKLVKDLIAKGCVPRKSLILKWPNDLPEELASHFMRGYFDGDGSICEAVQKTKYGIWKHPAISICGTKEFLTEFAKRLNIEKCIYPEYRKKNKNCWSLKLSSKKRCKSFFVLLYKDQYVCLSRKLEKFLELQGGSTTIISAPKQVMV